ncbi:MAG: 50S ribosomal protein L11 methyltransferase [Chloroherpetonaceae bacterium]|nr:50S ribosomal protein L11 methyltransferase [Chloroherpetonaceae bacterium]MCS7211524.1 50S ribosomal protein L11 methyltransferase [Chloroherpetonaceae bacterium]MDW8019842.1 50S ribosomal protein L11 methyltransferase [Chloroherpetonaceae bacterium]MDW8465091.1 50S ribosomal protein L11 methyltransferase [Chloroherpetonaceae bacterium]
MQKKVFVEVSSVIGQEHLETAVGLLHSLGYDAFREEEDTLYAYLLSEQWNAEKEIATQKVLEHLTQRPAELRIRYLEDRNWNAEWEASLQPIVVSQRLAIVQSGKTLPVQDGQLIIEINPKMSFGTGYHETTRLVLRELERSLLPNDRVLDIGTGTGVLAIAARKLGNTLPILAVDNDEWAVENARENIAVNRCANIEVRQLDALTALPHLCAETRYTLILANLNRTVLDTLLTLLAQVVPQARLIVSGILKYDHSWLQQRLRNTPYSIAHLTTEGEWLCALLQPLTQ